MSEPVRIFLAGDSTVQTYGPEQAPQAGWGQYIGEFFQPGTEIVNRAMAARSSRTFVKEGRLASILRGIRPGDWLFIQMGHNDASRDKPERYTSPETEFPRYLSLYLDGARDRGAFPLLITPIARLHYENGAFQNDFPAYCAAMKRLGRRRNVPVIDLMGLWLRRLEQAGPETARTWYMAAVNGTDKTHFNEGGAWEAAAVLAEGIRGSGLPIARRLNEKRKEKGYAYNL